MENSGATPVNKMDKGSPLVLWPINVSELMISQLNSFTFQNCVAASKEGYCFLGELRPENFVQTVPGRVLL